MNHNGLPEDYPGGVKEMVEGASSDPYEDLIPLASRKTTEIKVRAGDGANEAEMAAKFGYSMPIAKMLRRTETLYGYIRDANIEDPVELVAIRRANGLCDVIFDADCLNRQGRYDEEEERAQQWMKLAAETPNNDADSMKGINDLLDRWSEADAFMLQAKIVEERDGIDAAAVHYKEFAHMEQQRDDVQMEAAKLPPAANMLFWCRVRQYKIMRERAYDLALGYPIHDFTEVKRKLLDGGNVHDLIPEMAWPWKVAYQLVTSSTADGESYRTMMMAMYAQQLPSPQVPQAWGAPNGYYPPYQNGQQGEGDDEDQPDKRPALFGFFGRNGNRPQQEPEKKQTRRRSRGRR